MPGETAIAAGYLGPLVDRSHSDNDVRYSADAFARASHHYRVFLSEVFERSTKLPY